MYHVQLAQPFKLKEKKGLCNFTMNETQNYFKDSLRLVPVF